LKKIYVLGRAASHRLEVTARSSLYTVSKRAFPVSGAMHLLERSASGRRICAVTRGFQTTTRRPFCFPVPTKTLSHDSCVTITVHYYCDSIVWTLMVLAIIKNVYDDDRTELKVLQLIGIRLPNRRIEIHR